jgi:hypothetical protein
MPCVRGRRTVTNPESPAFGPLYAALAAIADLSGPWLDVCVASALLTGASGESIALLTAEGTRDLLGASDPVAAELEQCEVELGEGPGWDAWRRGSAVVASDLAGTDATRWVGFSAEATRRGVRSVVALPVRAGAETIGITVRHRMDAGEPTAAESFRALFAADLIAVTILRLQAGLPPGDLALELHRDRDRAQIHQSAGMVSVQLGISVAEALLRIRAFAFAHGRPLRDISRDIVARQIKFEREVP